MSFLGSIAGGVASSLVGGLFGGGGGGSSTSQTQQTWANPFSVNSGLFNTAWGPPPPPQPSVSSNPRSPRPQSSYGDANGLNRIFTRLSGNADPTGNRTIRDAISGIRNANAGGGGNALNMSIADPRLQAISNLGLDQAGLFFSQAMDNPAAARAGELGLDFLNQLEADPMQVAQRQYNLLNPILQQEQERELMEAESRLFSQGRLGSTGGSNTLNAYLDAQRDAERKLLFDSLGQGMAVQAQNAGLGATLSQLDPALRGSFQGLGANALNVPLSIQNAMLQQAQVGGGLAGATNTGTLNQPGVDMQSAIGAGLLNSGIQGLTNAIPGLFQGSTTGNVRPAGYSYTPNMGPTLANGYTTTTGR